MVNSQIENLKSEISKVIKDLGISEKIDINLEIPPDSSHGDYTTNVAFQLSKILKKSPLEIASTIVKKLEIRNLKLEIAKVEALAPGFINFWISNEKLLENAKKIIADPQNFGKTNILVGKKIVVEFTDPNPFKEFHIGHVYTNTVGESLSRIFEANGATVWRADYFGDVGMHVAKAIWGILHSDVKNPDKKEVIYQDNLDKLIEYAGQILKFLKEKTLNERIKFMGQGYALGSTLYEESERAKSDVIHLNKLIYIVAQKMWEKEKGLKAQVDYQKGESLNQKELDMLYELYTKGRKWSLEYFDSLYSRLGMHFNGYYPESIAGERGYSLVKNHIKDGVFEESDGAIIFKGGNYALLSTPKGADNSRQGLHTRVFINSLGLPTYEAKELGLAPWKYEDFKYDRSIIVTGSEIREYFKVLIAAMKAVEPELGNITMHLPHGMVRLPEGKMSSRTGKIITGEWLMDEAKQRVKGKVKRVKQQKEKDLDPSSLTIHPSSDEIAEQIGIGAIKYAFLKSGIGKDIEFDFDNSLSFEGASGPYLQYSYVRTQSILEKAKDKGLMINDKNEKEIEKLILDPSSFIINSEEILLLRKIFHYEAAVAKAGEKYAPNIICEYLFDLAQLFSGFYQNNRIVDAKEAGEREFRLSLTKTVGFILEHGLSLLGIVAPKRM